MCQFCLPLTQNESIRMSPTPMTAAGHQLLCSSSGGEWTAGTATSAPHTLIPVSLTYANIRFICADVSQSASGHGNAVLMLSQTSFSPDSTYQLFFFSRASERASTPPIHPITSSTYPHIHTHISSHNHRGTTANANEIEIY